jgi:outer membrane receptor protein involved in Fe transport
MKALLFYLAIAIALCLGPTHPAADGLADEADLQFTIGAEAYAKGDFTSALEHFLASNRLVPNRNVMFNIARAYEQLSRFPDAYRYYVDASRGEVDARMKGDISAALARIGPKVAVLIVETNPPRATVYINRKELGSVGTGPAQLGLKAGKYAVIVELDGYEPAQMTDVSINTGESKTIKLDLKLITGTVKLVGTAGTKVRIDDERGPVACVLPCSLDVPPGQHIAYFERTGFTVSPQQFTLDARETITVSASSVAVVGSLLVSADETNALVEVDGKPFGFTPAVIPNIPIGKRRVRVSLRGYQPVEREVEIRVNAQTDLRDLVLVPERSISAASREVESIDDAPASITVISAQELEAFAYPTILEALRGVRGYAINYDSTYGNAAVRGLGQANDFSNRLLVLSDGAVLNENILYQPFIHYDGRVDLGDVQRIEIVRGPSSALYGTGAVSGVVNLVLKDRDEPDGAHVGVSSYDNSTARLRVGLARKLTHDAGVWASVAAATSQGRSEELEFDAGDGEGFVPHETRSFDAFDAYSLTGKTWFKSVTLQTFWTAREETIPTGNYSSRYGDTRSFSNDQRFMTELKLEQTFGKLDVLARAHLDYAYYHLDYWYDDDPSMPDISNTYNYFETYKSWWGGGEGRLSFRLGEKVKLSVGGEAAIHSTVHMGGGSFDVSGTMFEEALNIDAPYTILAGSALLDIRPSDKLRLQGGLRFDYWSLQGNINVPEDERGATSFPAVSPRVVAIIKPTELDIVKLMFGSAFRAPSAYEYYYNDGGSTQVVSSTCGETLDPERVYSGEVELTHRFNSDWVGMVSGYGTLARNVIETVEVGDPCAMMTGVDPALVYYRNSDVDQRMVGGDVELRREFRGGVLASAHYGFLNARYIDTPEGALDRQVANAPTNFAGFKVIFPIVQRSVNGAFRASFEDARRIDTTTQRESDRALVADAVLSGTIARYQIRYAAGVYNIFNWRYALPAFPYASDLMPQSGRSFMFSLAAYR